MFTYEDPFGKIVGDRITWSQSQDRGRALSSIPSSDYLEQHGPGADPAGLVFHVKPSYSLHLRYEVFVFVFEVCILPVVDDTEGVESVFCYKQGDIQ